MASGVSAIVDYGHCDRWRSSIVICRSQRANRGLPGLYLGLVANLGLAND
jgi:hypothetical protein